MKIRVSDFFLTSQELVGAVVCNVKNPAERVCVYYAYDKKRRTDQLRVYHTVSNGFRGDVMEAAKLGIHAMASARFLLGEC